MKNLGEKEEWAYPGTAQIFGALPIISGTGKATDFKFGQYIQRVHTSKSPLKILEKRERARAYAGTAQFFSGTPLLSQEQVKLRNLNFACMHSDIYKLNRNKSPLKSSGKVAVGVVRDSRKFSGHSYIGRIARSSLR